MRYRECEAMQLAIEAMEESLINGKPCIKRTKAAIKYAKEVLAEEDRLTWHEAAIHVGEHLGSVGLAKYYDMTAKQWCDWAMKTLAEKPD